MSEKKRVIFIMTDTTRKDMLGCDYFGTEICPEGWDKDYWYDMRCYLEELTEEERRKSRKKNTALEEDIDEKFTYAHRCSDRAVDFIEKHKDEPYFLTVSYDEPHDSCLCPREFYERYLDYFFCR